MKLSELPTEIQQQLAHEKLLLPSRKRNTGYEVLLYNAEGTRYFYAKRYCAPWWDDKGHYMPFGGGTYWEIAYGAVQFRKYKSCCGTTEYELCDGKRYGKSANGTEIPRRLGSKKEVLELIRKIGIFKL